MHHLVATLGKLPLPDNDERILPGDELLPPARYGLTHYLNAEAPPELI